MIEVDEVGPARAEDVLASIRAGFGARELLEPPSTATAETLESVRAALRTHGGLVATAESGPVGAVLFDRSGDLLVMRRLAVRPDDQSRGVARALVRRAEQVADRLGFEGIRIVARAEIPRTVRLWQHLGYTEIGRDRTRLTFAKVLPVEVEAASADAARLLGSRLARILRAGDLVILSGGLGAGKTTFAQGVGAGLGVRGEVTSPTFVISRVHPSLADGPALVHVDAYRLGGVTELDDLDLDTTLDDAVTLVEWGEDVAEGLAADRLEVQIDRVDRASRDGEDRRTLRLTPVGPRWVGAGLRTALTSNRPDDGTA
ncbi:hypothetical protein BH18ACT9_BH18ACT9_03720 [soil metagenome]